TVIPDDVFQLVSSDPRVVLTPISSTISDTTLNLICYSNLTITPSPLDHDFGEVPVGSKSASLEIALSNSDSATGSLVIKEINFTGPDKGDFTGNVGACGSHTILDPGDSCKASVAFFPKSAGAKSTTIEIITNDPDNPRWTGTLKGTGVPPQDIPVAPRNVPFRDIPVGKASDQTARVEKATPGSGIMG
ncbi:MAG: choice-of-anchor D domain-containing protein, partial [Deltaproteobacteria bacterium]